METTERNLDGLISSIGINTDKNALKWTYQYDALNNIRSQTGQAFSQTFYYDKNNRLEYAKGHYGEISYEYDANGNRLKRSWLKALNQRTEVYNYLPNSNRLSTVAINNRNTQTNASSPQQIRRLHYHANGQLIRDQRSTKTQTLNYNEHGRLKRLSH